MNASVYLFGEFNSGYSQYPDDYASSIFQKFSSNAKATTQVAIHRDGNLVYYAYIRKLQQDKYIGLCVVLNSLVLNRIDGLFSFFESTIASLVTKGNLIHFNEQGDIVTSVEKLYLNREEVQLLSESLRAGFGRFESCVSSLPAVNYATSKDSCKDFCVDDDLNEIIKSSYTNGYTYIYKSKNFNTAQLNSYKGVLSKSNKEKQELQSKLDAIEKDYAKVLRQKKQYKVVIFLFMILFVCVLGIFSLNQNLNLTKDALSSANDTISMQNDSLYAKNSEISNLHNENDKLDACRRAEESLRIEAENNFEQLKQKISDRQPFIVKSTSFDFNSGYLRIDYYGMTDESVNVKVNAYDDYGTCLSNSSTLYITSGDNTASIYLSRNLDSRKWYSFELIKGNTIIGGDRH